MLVTLGAVGHWLHDAKRLIISSLRQAIMLSTRLALLKLWRQQSQLGGGRLRTTTIVIESHKRQAENRLTPPPPPFRH